MSKEERYYEEVKKALIFSGIRERQAIEFMNSYHLEERLSDDYLFMAHYDPRDIADEILEKEAKALA